MIHQHSFEQAVKTYLGGASDVNDLDLHVLWSAVMAAQQPPHSAAAVDLQQLHTGLMQCEPSVVGSNVGAEEEAMTDGLRRRLRANPVPPAGIFVRSCQPWGTRPLQWR